MESRFYSLDADTIKFELNRIHGWSPVDQRAPRGRAWTRSPPRCGDRVDGPREAERGQGWGQSAAPGQPGEASIRVLKNRRDLTTQRGNNELVGGLAGTKAQGESQRGRLGVLTSFSAPSGSKAGENDREGGQPKLLEAAPGRMGFGAGEARFSAMRGEDGSPGGDRTGF